MKYDGFIIYSDFDGTLTNPEHVVHEENIDAISYFIKNGGRFSLATGRGSETFVSGDESLNIPVNAPLILANGSEIYDIDKGICIKRFAAPDSISELTRKIYDTWANAGLSIYSSKGEYKYRYNKIISDHITEESWLKNQEDIDELDALSGAVLMLNVFGDDVMLKEIREYIESNYDREFVCTTSYANFMNVTPRGVSKGDALSYLEKNKFNKEDMTIITVGDNENDKEMFETADFSFVMGNCNPDIANYADIMLKDNTYASIPQIINYIDSCIIGEQREAVISVNS